jgi:hypothetical protein
VKEDDVCEVLADRALVSLVLGCVLVVPVSLDGAGDVALSWDPVVAVLLSGSCFLDRPHAAFALVMLLTRSAIGPPDKSMDHPGHPPKELTGRQSN